MKRGNLSRDKTTFSWKAEGGVRKQHRLSKHDILIQTSLSGDEFLVQQKGKLDQFLLIDSTELERYLHRSKTPFNIYMTPTAFQSLPHSLGSLESFLHIVYPAFSKLSDAGPSSTPPPRVQPPPAQPPPAQPPRAQPRSPPPQGLYVWMQENEVLLFNLLCNSRKLQAYLRQAVTDTCDDAQFSALTRDASCRDDEHISKCVRRLLTQVHPDKLPSELQSCGQSVFQKISEAYAELKSRSTFDPAQPCSG